MIESISFLLGEMSRLTSTLYRRDKTQHISRRRQAPPTSALSQEPSFAKSW